MKERIGTLLLFILIFTLLFSISASAEIENSTGKLGEQNSLTEHEISQIESWVGKNMKNGKIPGVSVVIVKGDKAVYTKGFGYADNETKQPVTVETLFELGSNSKAFTALGILKLEKEGRIHFDDPVKKYIPWFQMKYVGEHRGEKIHGYIDITLEQLLHHTSGIPFKSIGDIPVAEGEDALEKTVRTQVDKVLDFYPGDKFQYATINYDILGLVIQNVSGQSFEQYVKGNIFEPLGLHSTYASRNASILYNMATGYKMRFLKPVAYAAPVYRGNTPAGYFITNTEDLTRWIKVQLGTQKLESFDKNLIDISHVPDRTVSPNADGSSYACGWSVFQDGGGMISHGGSNPNYSSYILLRPYENMGVGILANLNSSYVEAIAKGINDIIKGEKPRSNRSDTYISIDNVSFTIVLISIPVALATIYMLSVLIIQIGKKKRKFIGSMKKVIMSTFFFLLFISGMGYCIYSLPDVLYWGLPWTFIKVWAPYSLIIAVMLLWTTITIFCAYFVLTVIFPKSDDRPLFIIATLSIVSGFANAIIIFVINEALNRDNDFQTGLLLLYSMGIIIYVYGQRLVRVKLLTLTNDVVYNKRIHLINQILNAPYEKIEQLENGKIHAGLNNDTETISNFANIIITAVTSLVTLLCCFVYLGIINLYGLLVSIAVIFIAAGLYFAVGRYANKLWENTRDIQNVFFKLIHSLVNGFKELKIHNQRKYEFRDDMQASCKEYRDKRVKGDLSFANVFVIGELLFTLAIGVVAFIFPVFFKDIQTSSLRNYIFVFLYMTGPVHGVLNSIPEIIKLRISYARLNDIVRELDNMEPVGDRQQRHSEQKEQFELALNGVEFSYKGKDDEMFSIGPISYSFKSGEITFITGGNGSGKSTFAKIITGLYTPDKGEILLNGNKTSSEQLSQEYSAIFSDFYLFEKLYGINCSSNAEKINLYLKLLRIDDKVEVNNGVFSTVKLSSGQRKRLALLVSYLEDKPAYLFDEWAADQDPEFKEFFYKSLLPGLKKSNRCVIVITHDDRYFSCADKVCKMELGKLAVS